MNDLQGRYIIENFCKKECSNISEKMCIRREYHNGKLIFITVDQILTAVKKCEKAKKFYDFL